jgi:hypothetical protein
VSDSPTLHSRWLLFFKVMIISLWNCFSIILLSGERYRLSGLSL